MFHKFTTLVFSSAPPPRKNERYVCGYGGEKRCGQLVDGPLAELLFLETVEGNFCEEGFFRNGDGECVTLVDCGCKYSNSRGERASLRVSHDMLVCLSLSFYLQADVKSGLVPALPIRICFV